MDQGFSYQYGASSYPRYRYFQQRLQWILPRWQKNMETCGLPDCISHGREKMKKLTRIAHHVNDTVKVNVFSDEMVKTETEVELRIQRKDRRRKKNSLSLESHIVDLQKSSEDCKYIPSVTIFITTSTDFSRRIQCLEAKLSHLPKETLHNVIIYMEDTNTNYQYLDLVDASLDWRKVDYSESDTIARSKQLPKQIQYILEEKVVTVLELIADYIKVFVPKTTDDSGDSLQDAIYVKLLKGLKDPFVVKDLSPDQNGANGEKIPTDEELNTVASAVGRNWELLGPSLGISASQIDEIKKTNVGTPDRVLKMLFTWRKHSPTATLSYLLQVIDNVSAETIKGLKAKTEHKPHAVSNAERDTIFQEKLLEYIEKKTKSVVCDVMSKKCGISSSLINEFMNKGFFGLEEKVKDVLRTAGLPQWPREKLDDGVRTCKTFSYRCAYSMNDLIIDTEDYIKDKYEKLRFVKRLQFELFRLLQTTVVSICTTIPVIPKLPLELQKALLEIPEVYGCGTLWGELVLHITHLLPPSKQREVKKMLIKHNYFNNFSCQLVEPCREQVSLVQHGTKIRAKTVESRAGADLPETQRSGEESATASNEDSSYKCGTLGCFIKIMHNEPNDVGCSIYAVTCAHCLHECDANVEIMKITNEMPERYHRLGEKRHEIYLPESLDVATVEVDRPEDIDVGLQNLESIFSRWSFHQHNAQGMTVYMHGGESKLRRGICASVNYQTKKIKEINDKLTSDEKFDPLYNILISPLEGENSNATGNEPHQEEAKPFSQDGDSGSVVCDDDPDTGDIFAIALLHGDIKIKGPPAEVYSYSSSMIKTMKRLEEKYKCTIKPAYDN